MLNTIKKHKGGISSSDYDNRGKIVITGIGAIAPNGIGVKSFWKSLKAGVNCIDFITFFDTSNHPTKIAAEIKNFDGTNYSPKEKSKKMARASQLATSAAIEAIEDGKFILKNHEKNKIGIFLGSGAGGLGFYEKEISKIFQNISENVSEDTMSASFAGALLENIRNILGIDGPSLLFSNGCTSANDAIGIATNMINSGILEVALAGGADACITSSIAEAFSCMGALSISNKYDPKSTCRPFNIDRDGFVIGEGAWIFILESEEHALKRGAFIYAEVAGFGATCDAYHATKPLPTGEEDARAIQMALQDANIMPEELSYICAHGTSTPLNDKTETLAIKTALGKHAYFVPVSSIKSMIGHAVGGASAGSIAACAMAIKDNFIPPTINYEKKDPECDLDYVPNTGRKIEVKTALINSIGFGSKNAAVVLKKYS